MFTGEVLEERFGYQFSYKATTAINFAEEEARRFNHYYVGTEHLLLGLLKQGVPPALESLKIDTKRCKEDLDFIIGRGAEQAEPSSELLRLTPRANKIIELSISEAIQLAHRQLLPEHLWLGVVREEEGIAGGILMSLGVHYDTMKQQVSKAFRMETVTNRTLRSLEDLRSFVEDPNQDLARKVQVKMILDGALGLMFPNINPKETS